MEALHETGVTVRPATPDDTVGGVLPRWVALPESTAEVAALMRVSAAHDLAVVPAGNGTKLGWGNPPERCDLLIDTRRLLLDNGSTVEHSFGDLVAQVGAGLPSTSSTPRSHGSDRNWPWTAPRAPARSAAHSPPRSPAPAGSATAPPATC